MFNQTDIGQTQVIMALACSFVNAFLVGLVYYIFALIAGMLLLLLLKVRF